LFRKVLCLLCAALETCRAFSAQSHLLQVYIHRIRQPRGTLESIVKMITVRSVDVGMVPSRAECLLLNKSHASDSFDRQDRSQPTAWPSLFTPREQKIDADTTFRKNRAACFLPHLPILLTTCLYLSYLRTRCISGCVQLEDIFV
jgi:hypothetical protein